MALGPGGVYFVHRQPGQSTLGFYDLADGSTRVLTPLPDGSQHLAIAPDGSAVLYERARDHAVDIIMIDGFR